MAAETESAGRYVSVAHCADDPAAMHVAARLFIARSGIAQVELGFMFAASAALLTPRTLMEQYALFAAHYKWRSAPIRLIADGQRVSLAVIARSGASMTFVVWPHEDNGKEVVCYELRIEGSEHVLERLLGIYEGSSEAGKWKGACGARASFAAALRYARLVPALVQKVGWPRE